MFVESIRIFVTRWISPLSLGWLHPTLWDCGLDLTPAIMSMAFDLALVFSILSLSSPVPPSLPMSGHWALSLAEVCDTATASHCPRVCGNVNLSGPSLISKRVRVLSGSRWRQLPGKEGPALHVDGIVRVQRATEILTGSKILPPLNCLTFPVWFA